MITECQFPHDSTTPATYDGKTIAGYWAYMCQEHFDLIGVGLGTGKGQRLQATDEEIRAAVRSTLKSDTAISITEDGFWTSESARGQWYVDGISESGYPKISIHICKPGCDCDD